MDRQVKTKELRHDRHTVSLLTDHLVITPKYRGKILTGEVAFVTEAIIRGACAEMSIKIIDMAVNADRVHIFFQYPPKYSLSYIAKKIKGRSSRLLRQEFPHLREWCDEHLWSPGCYHGSVGQGGKWWRNTFPHRTVPPVRKLYRPKTLSSPVPSSTGYSDYQRQSVIIDRTNA